MTKQVTINYGRDGEAILDYKPLTWQKQGLQYTASGYGAKIPTFWVIRYKNKVRRVYCTIYSNAGTCWFMVKGVKYIVS